MSESNKSGSGWGLWSLVETVKQKSEAIVNIYKEDLNEFSKTIVTDTTTVLQDKLASLRVFSSDDDSKNVRNASSPIQQQNRIARLQRDLRTYTDEPADSASFSAWSSTFDIGSHTESVTHLLTSNEIVREFHTRLVPAQVSYRDFWCRYYFRLHCLLEEDKRRAALLKSAIDSNDDEELSWDVEDDKHPPDQQGKITAEEKKLTTVKQDETVESPHQDVPPSPTKDINTIESANTEKEKEIENPQETSIQPISNAAIPASSPPPSPVPAARASPITTSPSSPITTSPSPITTSSSPPPIPIEDEIDHEIAQKYVEIQSDRSEIKKEDEDEWASWE